MPRKSSSHFVAHLVTAFVDRLRVAIHQVAAARAHSEVLRALGGGHAARSRSLRAKTKHTELDEAERPTSKSVAARRAEKATKQTTKRIVAKTASKPTKAAAKSTTKSTTKKAAKTAAKAATKAAAKTAAKTAATKTRAKAKPKTATKVRAHAQPAATANAARPDTGAPISTPPTVAEAPPVPPGAMPPSEDTASPAAG